MPSLPDTAQPCRKHTFNPSKSVRERLKMVSSLSDFDIPTLDEMMALLGRADSRYALAA
jgi:hypothetical protein